MSLWESLWESFWETFFGKTNMPTIGLEKIVLLMFVNSLLRLSFEKPLHIVECLFSINSRADYSHSCIEPLNWVHRRCIIISLDLECGSHWNFSNSVWRGFPLWKTFEERTLFVSESRSKLKSPFEPSYRVELEIVCRLCLLASFRCGNAVEHTKFHLWKHFIRGSHPCVFDIQ